MFPLVIKHQRSSVLMHNAMPEMTALQTKMQNAKVYGNHVEGKGQGKKKEIPIIYARICCLLIFCCDFKL